MTVGTVGFVSERLRQAREARGLNLVSLAELVEVSSASISHYEKGEHAPRAEILRRLANALNVPLEFLLNDELVTVNSKVFYRSMSSATKQARSRAERRFEWLKEIVVYLEEYFDLPDLKLPELDIPEDFRDITDIMIESMAAQVRDFWTLGHGPIANLTRTLEANGIVVTRGQLSSDKLDAFSEFDQLSGKPYVFLGSDKNVMVRSRFDAGHELFHLLAHRNVDDKSIRKPADYKILEQQAHRFSLALLLPEQGFCDELWDVSLDGFRSMKARWKVSVAAMIFRAQQLGLVDENGATRLRINLTRRGWRTQEPLDDLPVEQPKTLARCFELLVSEEVAHPEQILAELRLPPRDVEELAALQPGFFGQLPDVNEPRLKDRGNVVRFTR